MTARRWKLTIEYKGTAFHGWQRQEDGVTSVQQAVEDAFHAFCGQRIPVQAAGRTDAGVHARGQVAHADLDYGDRPLTGESLAKALNAHLRPRPVCVTAAQEAAPDFHARFGAVSKLYTYRIICRPAPLALDHDLAWHIRHELDTQAMQEAAQILLGHHDFSTFRDSACQAKSPERTLDRLDVETRPCGSDGDGNDGGGREILIHAQARSFLHHQVRNMTGALALVGAGKWSRADMQAALEARDRTKGGPTAPAEGLYLVRVDYPDG